MRTPPGCTRTLPNQVFGRPFAGGRAVGLALIALLAGGWEGLRQADPDVEQGNRAYREGRFADALSHYRAAEERGVDSALHFDIGSALYKLGEKANDPSEKARLMQEAEDELRRAADTDDAQLKSSAYFNLGNTLYQREQWEDAIAAYKRALRADSKNDAARNNLEMALRQRQKDDPRPPQKGQEGPKGQKDGQEDRKDQQNDKGDQGDQEGQDDPKRGEPDPAQQGQPGQGGQDRGGKDPQDGQTDPRQGQDPGQGRQGGEPDRQPGQQGKGQADRQRDGQPQPTPSDPGDSMDGSPSDQDRKLDELERRSRELRKRLLRQGGKNRDPMKLPSRRDW